MVHESIMRQKKDMCDDARMSFPHSSPLIRRAVFDDAPPVTPRVSSVYRRPMTDFAASPLQRKGVWASPSVALSPEEIGSHNLGDPEPRENTWWDVWEQLPSVMMGSVQTMWMDLEALLHEKEMGCPIGACMHVISLGSQLLLPGTSFLFTQQSMQRQAHSHLFASPPSTARHSNDSHCVRSYSTYIGRLVVQRRTAALSYMVSFSRPSPFCGLLLAFYEFTCANSRCRCPVTHDVTRSCDSGCLQRLRIIFETSNVSAMVSR